jgi:DNA-binding SARP family transcriptional activator
MRFAVLGPLLAEVGGKKLKINGTRRQVLLGALLIHPSQALRQSELIDALWPEQPPRSAIHNIRTYVSELRRLIRRHDPGADPLVSTAGGYRLDVETDQLDLLEFRLVQAEAEQAQATGDHTRALANLDRAMKLWRGRPLEGIEVGDWLSSRLLALEERRWSIMVSWADLRIAIGHHDVMVPVLAEMVTQRPLEERAWELLIRARYAGGRTAEALSTYSQARQTFIDELGIEPGIGLRKLHTAILNGTVEIGPSPGPPGAEVITPGAVPHELPRRPPDFVGRDGVVSKLVDTARTVSQRCAPVTGGTSVVALHGRPGVGKSATAIVAAHEMRQLFPDGQLYASLAGETATADALEGLLSGFLLASSALPHSLEGRLALYRSLLADRRMLIVLDEAGDVDQIQSLLPASGWSLVVVTSRRRLDDLGSSWQLGLGPLPDQEAKCLLGTITGPVRVAAEPEAAARIVEACEGLPLAVRIAGARLAANPRSPLGALANRLARPDARLDELTFGGRDLRDAFRESYESLDAEVRAAFRQLGGSAHELITADHAGDVLDVPASVVNRVLDRLLEHNLLEPGVLEGQPGYRMSGLVQAYARELDRPGGNT